MVEDAAAPVSWVRRATTLFIIAAALLAFYFFFGPVSTVLLGVLAAAIVSCALNPLLKFIPGPRGVGAGVIGLGLIAAVGALVLAFSLPLAKPVQQQFYNWPQTKQSVDQLLTHWSEKLYIGKPMTSDDLLHQLSAFFATDRGSLLLAGVRDAM